MIVKWIWCKVWITWCDHKFYHKFYRAIEQSCLYARLNCVNLVKVGTILAKLTLSGLSCEYSNVQIRPNLVKLALSWLSYHHRRVELDQNWPSWPYRRVDLGQIWPCWHYPREDMALYGGYVVKVGQNPVFSRSDRGSLCQLALFQVAEVDSIPSIPR